MKKLPSPPPAFCAALCVRLFAIPIVRLASLSAPLALAAALLAIPADEARAHDDTSATLHAETYPLHQAAAEGDLDSVNHFIAVHTVAVNAKKADDGWTPLHSAAWRARFGGDYASIVSVLISAGADVNAKNGADFAPLHYVALVSRPNSRQAVPIVSALIAAGADVHAKGNRGRTPLHGASHLGIISVLIAEGADVNAKNDDDETPLHFAAYYNHASAASALIAEGADVHAKNDDDETPLHLAAREGHASAVSALIEAGANWGEACATSAVVNPAGPSPPCICEPPSVGTPENCVAPSVESCGGLTPAKFYSATLSACVAVAECASPSILNAEANRCDCPAPNVGADGADAPGNCAAPSAESCGGLTPPQFYSPTLSTCAPYDECLAAGNCAPSAQVCGGLTPAKFYDATAGECVPFMECASPLVLYTDANDCHAANALYEAAAKGDLDSVNHFITVHMADVNADSTPGGWTPLHGAAWHGYYFNGGTLYTSSGYISVISVLIAAGADVNAKTRNNSGRTPLHHVTYRGVDFAPTAVSMLIAAGADVNAKTDGGTTPLHFAADKAGGSGISVVAALIAAGADVNAKTDYGYTPLHLTRHRPAIASALIAAGADVNAKNSVGHTPLHVVIYNDVSGVAALIAGGADVNAKTDDGDTPLHLTYHLGIVATLIAAGADVNVKNNNGNTPLHRAAATGRLSIVSALIAAGADVHAKNNDGETPLSDLFSRGAPPRSTDYLVTIVSALIAAGADVNAKTKHGQTPLHKVAVSDVYNDWGFSVVSVLIAAGADVNAKNSGDYTPLHYAAAASYRAVSVVSALIAAGADVNAKNHSGETPLRQTCYSNSGNISCPSSRVTVRRVLIAAGGHWGEACANAAVVNPAGLIPPCLCESPNVETNLGACEVVAACDSPSVLNARTNRCDCPAPNIGTDGADAPGDCHAENALHEAARTGDLDAVNHLITVHMADVNATTSYGDTPLHYATGDGTGVGHVPVVSVLIAAGANVNAKEDEGITPLHNAALKDNIPVISMLIAAGADVNAKHNFGQTPLHEAAEGSNVLAISALIAAGASVNVKDAGGGTPLHEAARLAVYHISVAVFSALIVGGADVNAKNNAGETPLRAVLSAGVSEIWSVLIAAGGHWGEACENAAVVNPAGPSPPCVCESPNVETNLGACEVVAACTSPSVLNAGTNRCDCPAPNVGADGADAPGECVAASVDSCGGLTPAKFYDSAARACVPFVDCHDSAIRKADNTGCECPAGAFAHGDPSTATCHAGHAPIPHSLGGWLSAIRAKNPTLVAHFISGHGQNPDENYHLHSAARDGDLALAKALIAGGANLDRKNGAGDAPLHPAVRNERAELITLLLRRGADAGAKGDDGDTALHLAARRIDTAENAGLIAFLLDAGANPNVRNDDGWLPLDLAYGGGGARTWQARRGIMAALIDGGANWGDACRGGAIPNRLYDAADVARYPRCGCPLHISERDSFGACECPGHSHAQVNGRCLPKDSAQVEAEILKMETELLRLRAALVSLNARLSAAAEMPREAVEEIAEQAGDTAQEIKRRRDNFLALARADLAGAPPPPVAMSDTAAECRMLGGEVQIHSATGIRVCSGIDGNDTFCLVDSGDAYPCRGLFRHVRTCNDDYNRRALNPFFCGARCGAQKAVGKDCAAP